MPWKAWVTCMNRQQVLEWAFISCKEQHAVLVSMKGLQAECDEFMSWMFILKSSPGIGSSRPSPLRHLPSVPCMIYNSDYISCPMICIVPCMIIIAWSHAIIKFGVEHEKTMGPSFYTWPPIAFLQFFIQKHLPKQYFITILCVHEYRLVGGKWKLEWSTIHRHRWILCRASIDYMAQHTCKLLY